MPTTLSKKVQGNGSETLLQGGFFEASVFVALVFGAFASVVPAPLALPAASLVIVLSGLGLGALALAMRHFRGMRHNRMMEIAGVLVLFGFAAAIVSDNADVLHLFAGRAGI